MSPNFNRKTIEIILQWLLNKCPIETSNTCKIIYLFSNLFRFKKILK